MSLSLDPALREALRAAPKVELHLHLDGAMSLPWLLDELTRCLTDLGFTPGALGAMAGNAARAAFLPAGARARLAARVRDGWAVLG